MLALTLAACGPAARQPGLATRLDAYFSARFPPHEPGAAVMVVKADSVVFAEGYGLADLATGERITTRTLFNLGSISKTFVANAILILQERGKLSVEDSLIRYFPDFKNKGLARKVRIKHLLTHTSGLPDRRRVSQDTVFYLTAKDAENWPPQMLADTLEFEPGTRYHYSNPAFNALALIVEQVSGMKWQQFVSENIFEPSGMRTSTITDRPIRKTVWPTATCGTRVAGSKTTMAKNPLFPQRVTAGYGALLRNWCYTKRPFRIVSF